MYNIIETKEPLNSKKLFILKLVPKTSFELDSGQLSSRAGEVILEFEPSRAELGKIIKLGSSSVRIAIL